MNLYLIVFVRFPHQEQAVWAHAACSWCSPAVINTQRIIKSSLQLLQSVSVHDDTLYLQEEDWVNVYVDCSFNPPHGSTVTSGRLWSLCCWTDVTPTHFSLVADLNSTFAFLRLLCWNLTGSWFMTIKTWIQKNVSVVQCFHRLINLEVHREGINQSIDQSMSRSNNH